MRRPLATAIVMAWTLAALGWAAPPAPAAAPGSAPQETLVYTRATVHSVFDKDQGRKHYIRLKLGPGAGLPFRTLTFRVHDLALVAAFPPSSPVEFVARRMDGENTLVALRAAPRLLRFESH